MRSSGSPFPLAPLALVPALVAGQALAVPGVDARLVQQTNASPLGFTPVLVTYDHAPRPADLLALRAFGIPGGTLLSRLPIVLTAVNQAQLNALRSAPGVVSLYANRRFKPFTDASRSFIGATAARADSELTSRNRGLPVSGAGVGVAYVDTGIDATHPDLVLGRNVAQNVLFPLAEYAVTEMPLPPDFVPVVAVENVPQSDAQGGHGTFGAGVTAGTGQTSGGLYGGVAPGARLVGLVAGNDVGLTTFAIVQAYDYALVNQIQYNIRVCNNSWGTTLGDLPYDPFDPINVATRALHDHDITVVFAAGNDGDAPDVINPFSVAPWVISVAAGQKQGYGAPASFSSRGNDDGNGTDVAGQPANPLAPPNLRPDVVAPGVDIHSTRAKCAGLTNSAGSPYDVSTIAPGLTPFYTTSSGTSFSTPHVTGVVALMMEANPLLTPDQVVTILRETATPMPYPPRVVGAGYVDAHDAVRLAMGLSILAHPADLMAPAGTLVDAEGDQLGSAAHDIRSALFSYDSVARQILYTLTLADLSGKGVDDTWTISSNFGFTTIFVSASIDETSTPSFSWGSIAPDPSTGVTNQTTIGSPDSGLFAGNQIVIRLSIDKVNAAVGRSVAGARSTDAQATSQVLIGSSLTGGLLLNADSATGSDFTLGPAGPP